MMTDFEKIIEGINTFMPGVTDDDLIAFLKLRFANTIKSPTDPRDHDHEDKKTVLTTANWNPWVGFIENQQDKPRCVAQSIEVGARVKTNIARNVECFDSNSSQTMVDFDAQELYYLCKRYDGVPDLPGTFTRVGLKMLQKHGITENRPNENQVYQCRKYWKCKNQKEALNDLFTVGPINIVVKWYLSFAFGNGVLIPKTKDRFVGLHAMTLTKRDSQDNEEGITRGINSHGPDWGFGGRFILPDTQWDTLVEEAWCFD